MGENHPLMSTKEYQAHVHVLKYTQMYTCICIHIHTTHVHSYTHAYIRINGCYKMVLLIIMFLFSKACRVQRKRKNN